MSITLTDSEVAFFAEALKISEVPDGATLSDVVKGAMAEYAQQQMLQTKRGELMSIIMNKADTVRNQVLFGDYDTQLMTSTAQDVATSIGY